MNQPSSKTFEVHLQQFLNSHFLGRKVRFDVVLPPEHNPQNKYPAIFMNDGQDFEQLELRSILNRHYTSNGRPHIFIAVHCNENRLQEYGTAYFADYKNRGSLATDYMHFMCQELVPHVRSLYGISELAAHNTICGFSLGGLSAFDIAWENPHLFSKIGVFSASFWWRSKSYEEGYADDLDRILHKKIRTSQKKPGLQFWLECGTADETADRNNNGIIDAIEDTLDIIAELTAKGYNQDDIKYEEIEGGEHNFDTWKKIFPSFLAWNFSH